jgi:hypothetical protein
MGMYDILKISPVLLPVDDEIRKSIEIEKVEWQTKDLDNCLSNLEISQTGRLTETIRDAFRVYITIIIDDARLYCAKCGEHFL